MAKPDLTRWRTIAEALRKLARGPIAPGELFPSTRDLGRTYGVHRHTVQLAFDALVAEGLAVAEPRRGYRALPPPPELARIADARATPATFHAFRIVAPPLSLTEPPVPVTHPLHAATPDPSLLPMNEIRAAYAHVIAREGARALDRIEERGHDRLHGELARYLRRARGFSPRSMILTAGSQEAIALAAQTLLAPGDVVAVEAPGYVPAWDTFRAVGAEVVPIPVDAQGLRVDALAGLIRRRRVRLVYVTPTHHYPTTVTMSAFRRRALLALTLAHGVPILEDDYDHEYHFRGEPQPPLAASPSAPHVVYAATLSKLVAPGLRVGILAANEALVAAAASRRRLGARGGDGITQAALAEWIADGGFERHVRRARRVYAARRDAALATLDYHAKRAPLRFTAPDGGLAIWTTWPEHDTLALAERALARGVAVVPEALLRPDRSLAHGMRLAFARPSPAVFAEGVAILVRLVRTKSS